MSKLPALATLLFAEVFCGIPGKGPSYKADAGWIDTLYSDTGVVLTAEGVSDDRYVLHWVTRSISRKSTDTLVILPSGKAQFNARSASFLLLRQGCGTACSIGYALPLNASSHELKFMYPLALDSANDLLACCSESASDKIVVVNLITQKEFVIKRPFAHGPSCATSLDSIAFQKPLALLLVWRDTSGQGHRDTIDLLSPMSK